jgi:rare lipoprotein A
MDKRILAAFLPGLICVKPLFAQRERGIAGHHAAAPNSKPIKLQYGIASFYANKFNGRRTANGEIFSQQLLTAASNTLPLNSRVKVTNLRNKRSVVVRITDRMHHLNRRLIDLSRSAAHQLGYTGRGLVIVRVDVLPRNLHTAMAKARER